MLFAHHEVVVATFYTTGRSGRLSCRCCMAFHGFSWLCHVNSVEPKKPTLPQIKHPLFRTIERMPWREFDGEFGGRPDGVAN